MYENLTRLDLVGPALARALGDLGSEAIYMAPEARELVDRARPARR